MTDTPKLTDMNSYFDNWYEIYCRTAPFPDIEDERRKPEHEALVAHGFVAGWNRCIIATHASVAALGYDAIEVQRGEDDTQPTG